MMLLSARIVRDVTTHQHPRRWAIMGVTIAAGLAAGISCTSTTRNDDHCYYNAGNETCAARYGADLPYCATQCAGTEGNPASPNGDGCVDWQPPESCYSPCGGEREIAEDSTCLDVAGTDATSTASDPTSGSSGSAPTTSDDLDTTVDTSVGETEPTDTCLTSGDCTDPERPICVDDVCVPCGEADLPDALCAARDPDLPACAPSGACVQCTDANTSACVDDVPVCADQVCRGCLAHPECGDRACELATGECFPSNCVELVPGDHATLQAAVDDAADEVRCTVRVTADLSGAAATADVPAGAVIAIVREGGGSFTLAGADAPTLRVTGDSAVYIVGLRFAGNPTEFGLVVDGPSASLYVDDAEVVDNGGGGISVEAGASLRLHNSLVGGAPDLAALEVLDGSSADVVYTTLAGATGDATALACDPAADVSVRNSLLVGRGVADVACDAQVTYCAAETMLDGVGNMSLGATLETANQNVWFVNYPLGDYRLNVPPAVVATTARWTEGDPFVDLDGDPRAGVDGAMDHAGGDAP